MQISKHELIEAAYEITGGNIKDLQLDRLHRLITVTQFVTDLCLNEIERRGELTYHPETGRVIVPYQSDYVLPTIINPGHQAGTLDQIGGHYKGPPGPGEDFFFLAAEAIGFTAAMLSRLPNGVRPDSAIAELNEIFSDTPTIDREIAEAEIQLWVQQFPPLS